MGRMSLPADEVKTKLTIAIKKSTIDKLREIKNYNALIQKLLDDYFKNNTEIEDPK